MKRKFVTLKNVVVVRLNDAEIRNNHSTFYTQMAGSRSFSQFNVTAMSEDGQFVQLPTPSGGIVELPIKAMAYYDRTRLREALAATLAPVAGSVPVASTDPIRLST